MFKVFDTANGPIEVDTTSVKSITNSGGRAKILFNNGQTILTTEKYESVNAISMFCESNIEDDVIATEELLDSLSAVAYLSNKYHVAMPSKAVDDIRQMLLTALDAVNSIKHTHE